MDFYTFMSLWAEESGFFIMMFVLSGIFLSLFMEVIKKQIYPKYTDKEKESGKVEKNCPKWVGMLFGILSTIIFTACAIMAEMFGAVHSSIPGGLWFIPIWFVGFYLWQWLAGKLVKMVLRVMVPVFMTGLTRDGRKHSDERPVYEVPRGAKVKYVDPEVESNE